MNKRLTFSLLALIVVFRWRSPPAALPLHPRRLLCLPQRRLLQQLTLRLQPQYPQPPRPHRLRPNSSTACMQQTPDAPCRARLRVNSAHRIRPLPLHSCHPLKAV